MHRSFLYCPVTFQILAYRRDLFGQLGFLTAERYFFLGCCPAYLILQFCTLRCQIAESVFQIGTVFIEVFQRLNALE